MIIENFTVLGCSTAGLIAAIFLKNKFPESKIYIIDSEEFEIEYEDFVSSNIFVEFLKNVNIAIDDFVRETGATIRLGSNFINWKKNDNTSFRQAIDSNIFNINEVLWPDAGDNDDIEIDEETGLPKAHEYDTNKEKESKDFTKALSRAYLNRLSIDNVEFDSFSCKFNQSLPNIDFKQNDFAYGLHFDCKKTIKYLLAYAKSLGVIYHNENITDIETEQDEYIIKIKTENQDFETDFVVDCTDTMHLGIFQLENYIFSTPPYANLNSKLSFELEKEPTSPFTDTIALDNGWIHIIPLQDKTVYHYYFDDRFCDFEIAIDEVKNKFKIDIVNPTTKKFEAGWVEKSWSGNVIAIGKANTCIEPIWINNIDLSCQHLLLFESILSELIDPNQENNSLEIEDENLFLKQLEWNEIVNNQNREILDFNHLYYYNKRRDTDFWIMKKDQFKFSESLEEKMAELDGYVETATYKLMVWKENPVYYQLKDHDNPILSEYDFLCVIEGLELYDKKERKEKLEGSSILTWCSEQQYEDLKSNFQAIKNKFQQDGLDPISYIKKYELTTKI